MKIAIVGCGALGSYYGAKLARTGREVHFLLRSDYEAVRRKGVFIQSPEGDFQVNPQCAKTPGAIGVCDLAIIGLKTTANQELNKLLAPMVGPQTAILTLQNGLGNEELLAELLGAERIMGGLCFVGLNRIEPGVIRHMGGGSIVMGEFHRQPEPRTHDIASMIRHSGVPCTVTENLETAHWDKLVWNIPFNGLGVAGVAGYDAVVAGKLIEPFTPGSVLDTAQLLAEPRWVDLMRKLMLEIIHAAAAKGMKLTEEAVNRHINRTSQIGAYKASTLLDYENGLPLELESLFLEPLRQAQAAGVEAPILSKLCDVLRQLEMSRP